jgi:5'(3')-deoxyribonucleotidase
MDKKTLYIDMDGVLVDFQSGIDRLPEEIRSRHHEEIDNAPGLFGLMKPLPGAIEAYERLSEKFDTYILSTAPWENPSAWSDKLLWVKKYLGKVADRRLILSHHKNLLTGHFIIDDRDKRGVTEFQGEHIHFATPKFPDWKTVVKYLETKLEKDEKLRAVPVEPNTAILFSTMHSINGIDALYQIWQKDIYRANSVIFLSEDVDGMSQEAIEEMVKKDTVYVKGSATSFAKSDSGYTFFNFNFQDVEDDFSVDMEAIKKSAAKQTEINRIRKEQIAAREKDYKLQRPV